MVNLHDILVAVDITKDGLDESGTQALRQARRLAEPGKTKISLVHVLDISESAKRQIDSKPDSWASQHFKQAQETLEKAKIKLAKEGYETSTKLLFGKPWLNLIREVLTTKPGLLVAGPAKCGPLRESLFGSTTMKLLRMCPCPVWVTKLEAQENPTSVLVAHEMKEVGAKALRWGIKAAEKFQAKLHILHVLELTDHDSFLQEIPQRVIREESQNAREKLQQEVDRFHPSTPPEIVVETGQSQTAIFSYLKDSSIDLLVMGTVGRTGVSGLITGNTAEALLPWIKCSLIALKPDDFESPVKMA